MVSISPLIQLEKGSIDPSWSYQAARGLVVYFVLYHTEQYVPDLCRQLAGDEKDDR